MLGGGNQYAFLHQAGGVADLGDILAAGFDLVSFEIGAAKHDARSRAGGKDAEVDWGSTVKAHATARDRTSDCSLEYQKSLRKAHSIGYKARAKSKRGISTTTSGEWALDRRGTIGLNNRVSYSLFGLLHNPTKRNGTRTSRSQNRT